LQAGGSEESYQAAIGAERLAALADWSRSTADWKELFA